MNKSLILAGVLAMSGCSSQIPTIQGPYEIESVDLKNDVASVKSGDMVLEIEFDSIFYKDGNGYKSWNEFYISEVKSVTVFNEDGKTDQYVLPSEEVSNIVNLIEKDVVENME